VIKTPRIDQTNKLASYLFIASGLMLHIKYLLVFLHQEPQLIVIQLEYRDFLFETRIPWAAGANSLGRSISNGNTARFMHRDLSAIFIRSCDFVWPSCWLDFGLGWIYIPPCILCSYWVLIPHYSIAPISFCKWIYIYFSGNRPIQLSTEQLFSWVSIH